MENLQMLLGKRFEQGDDRGQSGAREVDETVADAGGTKHQAGPGQDLAWPVLNFAQPIDPVRDRTGGLVDIVAKGRDREHRAADPAYFRQAEDAVAESIVSFK